MFRISNFIISTLLLGLLSTFLVSMPALAATDILFSTVSVNVMEGESFDIAVNLNPDSVKNYTAKIELDYPVDILGISSFELSPGWIPLSQPGFDLIDNETGSLIKAGGYVGGFSNPATFGIVTFTAKKTGSGAITATGDSLILDAESKNVISYSLPNVDVTVHSVATETVELLCGNGYFANRRKV